MPAVTHEGPVQSWHSSLLVRLSSVVDADVVDAMRFGSLSLASTHHWDAFCQSCTTGATSSISSAELASVSEQTAAVPTVVSAVVIVTSASF